MPHPRGILPYHPQVLHVDWAWIHEDRLYEKMTIPTMRFPGLHQNGFEMGIVSPEADNLARERKDLPVFAEKQVLT